MAWVQKVVRVMPRLKIAVVCLRVVFYEMICKNQYSYEQESGGSAVNTVDIPTCSW